MSFCPKAQRPEGMVRTEILSVIGKGLAKGPEIYISTKEGKGDQATYDKGNRG